MRWVGHVAHMGARRGVDKVLVGKLEGKRTLERPIAMDQKVGWGCGLV